MGVTDLTGKHVVVVGGGSGIGRATAQAAAALGARVTLSSRNRDRLADVAQTIGGGTAAVPLDMTDVQSVAAWAGAIG